MGQCSAPAPAPAPPSRGEAVCAILQIYFTFYPIDTNTDIDTFNSFRQFMPKHDSSYICDSTILMTTKSHDLQYFLNTSIVLVLAFHSYFETVFIIIIIIIVVSKALCVTFCCLNVLHKLNKLYITHKAYHIQPFFKNTIHL